MRAGTLDREITIEARTGSEPDSYGTPGETWATFADLRAQRIEASTEEYLRTYGEGGNAVAIFRTRYVEGVTTDHRVVSEGKTYNLREVKEFGRRMGLELRCEEVRT